MIVIELDTACTRYSVKEGFPIPTRNFLNYTYFFHPCTTCRGLKERSHRMDPTDAIQSEPGASNHTADIAEVEVEVDRAVGPLEISYCGPA